MQTNPTNTLAAMRAFLMPGLDSNDITVRFSQRIRELRTSRGLNQIELAKQCGITADHLDKIESGRMAPTLVVLELLALGFRTSIAGLLEGL